MACCPRRFSQVFDPCGQEFGTIVEYVVDASQGSRVASVTFAGAQNAATVARGTQHLAALASAPPLAWALRRGRCVVPRRALPLASKFAQAGRKRTIAFNTPQGRVFYVR